MGDGFNVSSHAVCSACSRGSWVIGREIRVDISLVLKTWVFVSLIRVLLVSRGVRLPNFRFESKTCASVCDLIITSVEALSDN